MSEADANPGLEGLRIRRDEQPPRAASRRFLGPALATLAAAGVLAALAALFWPTAATEVRVETVRRSSAGGGASVLDASGYVTARRSATVSSKRTGRIRQVLVEEGMAVEQDQIVAELDDAAELAQLRLAEAQLASARSALGETRAELNEAERSFERLSELRGRGLASEAELDAARAARDRLGARLESNGASVTVAERAVAVQQQARSEMVIRAPFAGVVIDKNAQPGEMVSPISAGGGFTRTGICTLVDMESLEIEVDVNEAYLQRVRPGGAVTARLDAYPEWRIPAEVIAIVPAANREKATVRVRVGILERDPRVLPDMGAKVSFIEPGQARPAPGSDVISVEASALMGSAGDQWVFVAEDGQASRRAVVAGRRDGPRVAISSGLSPGERVVLDPPGGLSEGDEITYP
ncbi:MAG: efflux RND transporter periplasmic adaptor subunit [Gammaproteobacteria bacterium]|nr:efflux RND transporter periplasmic adaptor subunit [Gammaproteobacteria bacterium]MCY4166203.1 efflux RND transporter periplasmic adaptor subunit [Gammaproteobacteria bacterium]MCY4256537.1 efflux RND transporter periplasmic adaptor subunit [Gammaproteobacteria bacterium]